MDTKDIGKGLRAEEYNVSDVVTLTQVREGGQVDVAPETLVPLAEYLLERAGYTVRHGPAGDRTVTLSQATTTFTTTGSAVPAWPGGNGGKGQGGGSTSIGMGGGAAGVGGGITGGVVLSDAQVRELREDRDTLAELRKGHQVLVDQWTRDANACMFAAAYYPGQPMAAELQARAEAMRACRDKLLNVVLNADPEASAATAEDEEL